MDIITLGDKKISVGFEWELIPSDPKISYEAQMREIAKRTGFHYAIPFTYQGTMAAGFSDKKTKVVPGAIYLALAHQEANIEETDVRKNWVFVDKDANDNYWYCAVKDGFPIPAQDVISTELSTITEQLTDILKVNTYIVYSPLDEIKNFIDDEGIQAPVISKTFDDLTSSVDDKVALKLTKFKKLVGIPPKYIAAGAAVIVLFGVFLAYDQISDSLKRAKAVEMRKKQADDVKRQEESEYRKKVEKYYQDFYDARRKAFDEVQASITQEPLALSGVWENYVNFTVPNNGWKLSNALCTVNESDNPANKIKCSKVYQRGTNTTNKMLLDAEPTAYMTAITADRAQADSFFPTISNTNTIANYNFLTIDDFASRFVSNLQMLKYSGIKLEMSRAPEDIKFTPPALPLTKEETEKNVKKPAPAPIKIGYAKGTFDLFGNNLQKHTEMMKSFDWRSVSLQNTEFKFDNYANPAWKTQFNYVLKTKADNLEPGNVGQYTPEQFQSKK